MTDENLIRQIEQLLAALKAGDETALDRLTAILGDVVGGDKISVGDISDATAVAIGRSISMVVNQGGIPDTVAAALNDIQRALKELSKQSLLGYSGSRRQIRVFISSPGDVAEERGIAMTVIQRMNMSMNALLDGRVEIEVVAWDRPGAHMSMATHLPPQENIDRKVMPSQCDIVVVIFWARMGLPLSADRVKPEPFCYLRGTEWETRYLSGTEYEWVDGMQAALQHGKPVVLSYRRTEELNIKASDPDRDERLTQWDRVQVFFGNFNEPDGAAKWSYHLYEKPADFERLFEEHLLQEIKALLAEPIQAEPQAPTRTAARPVWPTDRSPFPGLRPFEAEDAPIFFGRSAETDALVRRLASERFVAVVAASGSGKSSLVRAGLIPRLLSGALPGVSGWQIVTIKPGTAGGDPFLALAVGLLPGGEGQEALAQCLRTDPDKALTAACGDILAGHPKDTELLLLVDQFEELFTGVDAQYREPFARALKALAGSGHARIVITLRADFYDRCLEVAPLKPLLESGIFSLYPPGRGQLYEMISGPADVAGLRYQDGLEWRILDDTGDDPGALALMAYALQQLYEESHTHGGKLTWEFYEHIGRVQGAIGEQAQDAFDKLSPEVQATLPVVFRELVEVDERGTATRKRAALSSVACDEACAKLVYALTDARLLMTSGGEYPVVEVAHEALFRSWPKLKAWIDEAQDDLILLRQVRAAADDWARKGQPDFLRWPAERLELVYAMRERLQPQLTELEQDFIEPEQERLLREIEKSETTHERRRDIGDRLAMIGDTRRGVGVLENGTPDIEWLPVTGTDSRFEFKDKDGKPYGTFVVQPFYIARYLVTYAQFGAFLSAEDGFANGCWWQGFPQEYVRQEMGQQRTKTLNSPRDSVSWYQSVAFSRWLNHRLHGLELANPGSQATARYIVGENAAIRLPTEWEWQWAAQSGAEQRQYPWGAWLEEYANTSGAGLNRTVAVGMYPHGAAVCGALDVVGNLEEWCLNDYSNPQVVDGYGNGEQKVLRAGSFYDSQSDVACAYRNSNNYSPHDWYYNLGLRVVVVPQ